MAKATNLGRPARKVKIELTPEQLSEVQNIATKEGGAGEKAKFLLLLASGENTRAELMEKSGKTRQQILNFINRFEKYGTDAIKKKYIFTKKPVRQTKISQDKVDELVAVSQQPPREVGKDYDNWTLLRLVNYLDEKYGIKITRERVRQILKKNGIRHHTSRKIPTEK